MKKNIILNTAIITLLTILIISCTSNTKPNIYHSLITIKTDSYTRFGDISVYVSKSTENNYEIVGIITSNKYSEEYDTNNMSYNINFYLDEGIYNIKITCINKEYIYKNQKIEKGKNYKYNLDELIIK